MCIRPPVQPAETKLLDRCVVEVVLEYCSSTTDPPDGGDILKGQNFHITQLVLATSEGDGGMVQHDAAFWCLRENFERQ